MKTIFIILSLMLASWELNAQWVSTNGPLVGFHIEALATDGTHILAGAREGIFLSEDDGATWAESSSDLNYITSLAYTENIFFAMTFGGAVYSSHDFGDTWDFAGYSDQDGVAQELFAHHGSLFIGTSNDGIFRSNDNGVSWQEVNNGLLYLNVSSFAAIGTTLFAGTTGGVFRSTDNGDTWVHVITGMANTGISALGVCGTYLYAGVYNTGIYRTSDNGDLWTAVNSGLSSIDVSSFASRGTNLFAATHSGGVFRCTNSTTSWVQVNSGLAELDVWALASTSTRLFAGTASAGIFYSSGGTWTRATHGLPVSNALSIAVQDSSIFVASNSWNGDRTNGIVFVSRDNGTSWVECFRDLWWMVVDLEVSGSDIYLAISDGASISTDGGNVWTYITLGLYVGGIEDMAAEGSVVMLAARYGGLLISKNKGSNWTSANSSQFQEVNAVEMDSGSIYIGTEGDGLFVSADTGVTWTSINGNLDQFYINEIAIDGERIFAETRHGLFLSRDGGISWQSADNGLSEVGVTSFAFHDHRAFVGTTSGIYTSDDDGGLWTAINEGFPYSKSKWSQVAIKEDLLIATYGYHGVFLNNTFLTSTDEAYRDLPEVRIFPNPAQHSITLETDDLVTEGILTLYNINGQQFMQHQISERQTTIDISSLPTGMYLVRYGNHRTNRVGRFVKE